MNCRAERPEFPGSTPNAFGVGSASLAEHACSFGGRGAGGPLLEVRAGDTQHLRVGTPCSPIRVIRAIRGSSASQHFSISASQADLLPASCSYPGTLEPERQLYRLLLAQGGDAYSRYNSLLRELDSFHRALDLRSRQLAPAAAAVKS